MFAYFGKSNYVLILLEYVWLVKAKPFMTLILSILFGILSITILYAEVANIFEF